MNELVQKLSWASWTAFGIVLAAVLHVYTAIPMGWSMLAVLVGWPAFGTIVTIDDDLPGGFSNPDGTTPPPWAHREFWGEFVLRTGIAGIGFAFDASNMEQRLVASTLTVIGVLIGVLMMGRRRER